MFSEAPETKTLPMPKSRSTGKRFSFVKPFRSLRWKLSLSYAALLTILLVGLGIVLVFFMGKILYNGAFQTFQNNARTAVTMHRGAYLNAISHKNVATNTYSCVPAGDAFQNEVANPIEFSVTQQTTVDLINPQDGSSFLTGSAAVPNLRMDLVQSLWATYHNHWYIAVNKVAAESYTFDDNGIRAGAIIIAFDYRPGTSCPNANKNIPAIVFITIDFSNVQSTVNSIVILLAISVSVLFIVGVIMGFLLTGASTRDLTRVAIAARKIARGHLDYRVGEIKQQDEVGEVARAFDDMADRVEIAFHAQKDSEDRVRQFLADASHEIRTPLTSINGYLEVLSSNRPMSQSERNRIIHNASSEAARLSRLVIDMFTLARFDTGRPLQYSQVDLGELIGEAVDQARLRAGAREVIFYGDGYGRLLLSIDRDRIKQVLLVLLDNALKYGRQDDTGWIKVYLGRTDQHAIIEVSDNGPGISEENLAKIFERFYRVQNNDQQHAHTTNGNEQTGTGLGLAIAQTIVEAHLGVIEVSSIVGKGTIFHIEIPFTASTKQTAVARLATAENVATPET